MAYKSFKFAGDYYGQLLRLKTRRERAEYALAIVEYGCAGIEPKMSETLMFGFDGIRGRIDSSVKASADMERKSEAGRKGAAARWQKDATAPCETDATASCKEKRGDKKRGAAAAAASCKGMVTEEEGVLWLDSEDGMHPTRREALETSYRIRTGKADWDRAASRIFNGRCDGCDGRCADACFEAVRSCIMAWDEGKSPSPVALCRKVLAEEVFQ